MKVFLIAGEKSGDLLAAKLIQALRRRHANVLCEGIGGEAMAREGVPSLFPMADIAVMGFLPVLARLPSLFARIKQAAKAIIVSQPDVLVIIDSPDFTHRVARMVRVRAPNIPIVNYVSPSVWAWRPGRAKAMRAYVDCVMALFPFEVEAHLRLGGPRCVFVGHPLVEHLNELRPDEDEARAREAKPPLFLIMPGSRRSEIERLMPIFGSALEKIARQSEPMDVVLPAVTHLEDDIRRELESWPVKPRVAVGDQPKLRAFRHARAALVASGTVTLELALANVPMAVAYRVSPVEGLAKYLIDVPSFVLANLVLGENVVPEFLQENCEPQRIADAVAPLVNDGPARAAQISAFSRIDQKLMPASGEMPSEAAARIVEEMAAGGRV